MVQSHGRADAVLPYRSGELLRDLLRSHGHGVTFEAFAGGHTIPPAAVALVAGLLAAAAGGDG